MTTSNTPENNPFEDMAKAFAKPTSQASGHYISQLTKAERETLEDFHSWMESTGFSTAASRASYKSYVAACMVIFRSGGTRQDLNSSQKSAMNKFSAYLNSKK